MECRSFTSFAATSLVGFVVLVALTCFIVLGTGPEGLHGTVVGPDGAPVDGCDITVLRGNTFPVVVTRVRSDTQGQFSADVDLPEPNYWLWALVKKEGLGVDWYAFDKRRHLNFRLSGSTTACAGVVSDAAGNPIKDALVYVESLWRSTKDAIMLGDTGVLSARSDENGWFEIAGLPSRARAKLKARADGHEIKRLETTLSSGARDLKISLRRDVTVHGRVTYQGQPVNHMRIELLNEAGDTIEACRTDEDGRYRFNNVSPDPLYIRPRHQWGVSAHAVGPLTPEPGETLEVAELKASCCGSISGTVISSASGRGIPERSISARNMSGDRYIVLKTYVTTNPAGRYTLILPPGPYVIECRGIRRPGENKPPCTYKRVTVSSGERVTGVDFRIHGHIPKPAFPKTARTRSRHRAMW